MESETTSTPHRPSGQTIAALTIAALLALFAACLAAVLAQGALYRSGNFDASAPVELTEWEQVGPDGSASPVELPRAFDFDPSQPSIVLTTVIDASLADGALAGSRTCLLVPAVYCDVRVSLDGELLFGDLAPEEGFASSAGKSYLLVDLPEGWEGGTLSIAFEPLLGDAISYGITAPELGGKEGIVLHRIALDAPSLAIGGLLVVIGTLLAVLHLATRRKLREGNNLGLIGLFAVTCGAYLLCQLVTVHLFQANSYATYFCEFYLFMLLPVILAALLGSSAAGLSARLYRIVFWLGAANCAVQAALSFAAGVELRVMLPATHAVIVALACVLVLSVVRGDVVESTVKRRLLVSVAPLVAGGILDLALAYVLVQSEPTTFFKLGVVAFVVLQALFSYRDYLEWGAQKAKQDAYRELAYTDALTQLGSRLAFEEAIRRLDRVAAGALPACFSVDIDNLKQVNDAEGHAAGDELIRRVGVVLREFAGTEGSVFRIGGDEFVVLFDAFDGDLAKRAADLEARSANGAHGLEPSFSVGAARFDPDRDASFERTLVRADEDMYEHKRARKAL